MLLAVGNIVAFVVARWPSGISSTDLTPGHGFGKILAITGLLRALSCSLRTTFGAQMEVMRPIQYSGLCSLINKPLEWTSFDVVNKLRYSLRSKIGHAGTSDPCHRTAYHLHRLTKRSTNTRRNGIARHLHPRLYLRHPADLETAPENPRDTSHITPVLLACHLQLNSTGIIQQIPPYTPR